jgi:hypothetical protein
MSEIGSGNVVPLREGVTPEHLEVTARDLFEKHWPAIDQAGEGNEGAISALEAEANAVSMQLKLSPDAIDKLAQLILAKFKARSHRKLAREVVEDFWRRMVSVGQSCHSADEAQAKAAELEQMFRSWIDKIAGSLSPADASALRETVEDEDKALALLRQTDRKAFFERLKLPDNETAAPRAIAQYHQSLGEVAVKTAVRAAVWEGVRALFRAF